MTGSQKLTLCPSRRCSTCSILSGTFDTIGRCATCSARDARAVDCGCGFLYADEACTGHEPVCIKCSNGDRELNEFGFCAPCLKPLFRWVPAGECEPGKCVQCDRQRAHAEAA